MSTRNLPYGYKMEKGNIIIDKSEAEYIRMIFELRANGTGVYSIGKMLYEKQIPFFSDTRDKAVKKVSAILYKPIYTGNEKYPEIIGKDVFDKIQKMKTAAFRKTKKEEKSNKPVEEYEFIINDETEDIRLRIKEHIEFHLSESVQIREMIIEFAEKLYSCIKQKNDKIPTDHKPEKL